MFVVEGFFHILDGIDHLLFLLCLAIPFRRFRAALPDRDGLHDRTLDHADRVSLRHGARRALVPPLVETLIAASIVYMALENIVSPALRRRWAIAFAFGLVHGFGFSFAMRDTLQFAGSHLVTSLLSFNVGVEIGQVVVLLLLIPSLELLFRFGVAERIGTIVLSAIVAHTGWHWMLERGSQLILYRFEWPVFDAAFFALFLQWMMIAVALAGLAWLVFGVFGLRPVSAKSDAMPPASDAHVEETLESLKSQVSSLIPLHQTSGFDVQIFRVVRVVSWWCLRVFVAASAIAALRALSARTRSRPASG